MLIDLLNILLPFAYFTLTVLYAIHFFSDEINVEKYLTPVFIVVLLVHAIDLGLRTVFFMHFPTATPAEVLTVIAFAMGLIYLWIESVLSVKTTGMFIFALMTVFQTISSATISYVQDINPILQSPLFAMHTGSAILGYSSLAISAMYALLYLLLFYDIKGSRFSVFYNKLPSLELLDAMNIKAAIAGFIFLSLTIILGIVWTEIAFQKFLIFDWKIAVAFFSWFIFGIVVISKQLLGWSGKRVAYFSLTGFASIMVSLTLVNYLLNTFHKFH